MTGKLPPLVGINVQLALARRAEAMQGLSKENAAMRGSGFDLTMAGPPHWDRAVWEAFKAQFGQYPYDATNKPPQAGDAPPWVKQLCGIRLNPAERMGGSG